MASQQNQAAHVELARPNQGAPAEGNVEQIRLKMKEQLAGPAPASAPAARGNSFIDWVKILSVMTATWGYAIVLYVILMYIMLAIGQKVYMDIVAGVFFLFYAAYIPLWYRFSDKGAVIAKTMVEEKLREMESQDNKK